MGYEIGIDVDGTFTGFVARSGTETYSGKTLTTPSDEATGIHECHRHDGGVFTKVAGSVIHYARKTLRVTGSAYMPCI